MTSVLFPQDGDTPLHRAAYYGNLDCVKALLTHRETSLSLHNKVSSFVNVVWLLCHIHVCV